MNLIDRLTAAIDLASVWLRRLQHLAPVLLLLARLELARVFFLSGLTKIRDWETTLLLFREEYQVPLLPPELAAPLGTAGELLLPVLLLCGAAGRFAALGLSVVNAVAAFSLPDMPPAAWQLHLHWAWLLAVLAVFGPGKLSLDAMFSRWRRDRMKAHVNSPQVAHTGSGTV